jgi:DNA-binding IclR family transcriptional regulator
MLVIHMMLPNDRKVLSYIKRRQGEPLTTQQIATATGVHYQTVRNCLARLRSAGLIDSQNTHRQGRRYWPVDVESERTDAA